MSLRFLRTIQFVISLVILSCSLLVLKPQTVSALYTTAQIDAKLDIGTDRSAGWDTGCRDYLKANTTNTQYTLRQIINGIPGGGGAAYGDETWLSKAGKPNTISPTAITYGQTIINLQVNSVKFLCGSLVSTDLYGATPNEPASSAGVIAGSAQNARWATSTNAHDLAPNAIGSTNMRPAATDSRTLITKFGVSPTTDGTVAFVGTDHELNINRSETSRYWFAAPIPVTYTSTNPIITSKTIRIRVYYKEITGYHATIGSSTEASSRVEQCVGGTATGTTRLAYSGCTEFYYDLSLNLEPGPAPPFNLNGVKIDDSGLDSATTTGYGGKCASKNSDGTVTAAYATNCGNGTITDYPFSNNPVTMTDSSGASTALNGDPFFFNGLTPGTYMVKVPDETNWDIVGYSIGESSVSNSSYLTRTANLNPGTLSTYVGGKSFSYTFLTGKTYSMRWIYKAKDLCSNVSGNQFSIPSVMTQNADGTCSDIASCGGVVTSVAPEENQPFKIKVNFNYTGLITPSPSNDAISVSGAVIASGVGFTTGAGGITSDDIDVPGKAFGTYSFTYTINGSDFSAPVSCPGSFDVGRRPYFKAYGGDIFAGGTFKKDGLCTDVAAHGAYFGKGKLLGSYNSATGGAGTQLAAIAMLQVDGVTSADLRNAVTGNPVQPSGLTFANTSPSPPFGGYSNMTTSSYAGYCAPDYFTDLQYPVGGAHNPTLVSANIYAGSDLTDGEQANANGSLIQLKSTGTLTKRATLFIDGDVIIKDDIVYASYTTIDTIPYFALVVRGNIYIQDIVQQIDGLYIAQPKYVAGSIVPDSGRIYTCQKFNGSSFSPYALNVAPSKCNQNLTINGALIAQRIVLQRTNGALKNALSNEDKPASPSLSPNIAEVINFTPEFYIGKPVFKTNPTKPDSILSLPPVL